GQGGDVWVGVRGDHFQAHGPVVGDGIQRVDRVQFPAHVFRIVHPGDAHADLEPQILVIAQALAHQLQVLGADVQGQFPAEHHYLLHRVVEGHTGLVEHLGEYVDDLIEVGAVGPLGGSGHRHGADQSTETGGVPGVGDAEHAGADLD